MRHVRPGLAVACSVALAGLAAAACGGGAESAAEPSVPPPPAQTNDEPPRGGTLQVGLVDWAAHEEAYTSPDGQAHYALYPQFEYYGPAFELFRCCLLRTLLSYNGTPTAEGGAEPRPDLAAELPTVSSDGLTWTFRLKPGLHYAPPYEDVEITSPDVVRGIERMFNPPNASMAEAFGRLTIGGYESYYQPLIEGTEAFASGTADSISGLETPDDYTLVVHLTEPTGDLAERFTLPATAPIPPGGADGHDDGFGSSLVASGPYMVSRYMPGGQLVLARNPSWDQSTDELRAAYADRIVLTIGLGEDGAYRQVEAGELDLVLDWPAPPDLLREYQSDPAKSDRVVVIPLDEMVFGALNVAVPPFDDVHVRRAVNLAVDKRRLVEAFGGAEAARVATHVAPDSLEGNLLLEYDPYATAEHGGDLTAAREEMALSRYDRDADGICDDASCKGVRVLLMSDRWTELADPVVDALHEVGLESAVEEVDLSEFYESLGGAQEPFGLALNLGFSKDFPNASSWFPILFGGGTNPSLVGADSEQLEDWGYPATSVPSVGSEMDACKVLVGGAQAQCWAQLDQLLMEEVVPWIPYLLQNETRIVSNRVARLSVDQYTTLPSLDRVELEGGS